MLIGIYIKLFSEYKIKSNLASSSISFYGMIILFFICLNISMIPSDTSRTYWKKKNEKQIWKIRMTVSRNATKIPPCCSQMHYLLHTIVNSPRLLWQLTWHSPFSRSSFARICRIGVFRWTRSSLALLTAIAINDCVAN